MRGAISDVRAQRHVHALRLPLGHAGMVSGLRDAGKAAGQLPQHRRHVLELSGRALEVGEPPGRFFGARRDVVGFGPVFPRDFGHGVDALAQLAEGLVLITRRGGDALGVGCRLGRRRDDRVQGLERLGRELLHAAHVRSSDTRRDTRARLSVASRPPDTSLSSASTPWRIVPVDWATAPAAWRIDSAARASVASCCVSVSTVSTSGRRSSVMWIAVASWFANVLIVITSFPRYTLRLWCSSSRVPIT